MRPNKLLFITIFFLTCCLTSCRSTRQVVPATVPVEYREKIVERMVPVQSPADSANIVALFECDSLNRVILKQLSETKGNRVNGEFQLIDGLMTYRMKVKPEISYGKVRDSIVYREVPVKVPVETIVNRLTWIQSLWIRIGKITVAGLILFGAWLLLKSKLKLF